MLTPTLMQVPGPQAASKAGLNNSQNSDTGEAASTDTSFSQTLSKEIAGRDQNRADEVGAETKVNAPAAASVKKTASSESKADDDGKTGAESSEEISAEAVSLNTETVTADMLALVGSLNQATATQPVNTASNADAPEQSIAPELLIAPGQNGLSGKDLAPGLAIAPGQLDASGLDKTLSKVKTQTQTDRADVGNDLVQEQAADPLIAGAALAATQTTKAVDDSAASDIALAPVIDPENRGRKEAGHSGRQDGLHTSATGLEARSANASKQPSSGIEGFAAQHVKPETVTASPTATPVAAGQSADALKELQINRSANEAPSSGIERAEPQNFKPLVMNATPGDGRAEGFRNLTDLFKNRSQQDGPVVSSASGNFQIAPSTPLMQALPLSAASPFSTGRLAPEVGSSNWGNALGQQVIWMAGNQQQTASLTLNPPDLGPLQVELSLSNDQATASFFAAQPEVRQALEAALPRLREMMSEAGIQLGQTTVGTSSQQQQAFGQNGSQAGSANAPGSARGQENAESLSIPVGTSIPSRSSRGIVDTFA